MSRCFIEACCGSGAILVSLILARKEIATYAGSNAVLFISDCCHSVLLGPVWEGGQKNEDDNLRSALYNSLTECHNRRFSSVAVPAVSSGIFGFPKRRCARVLFSAALEFFRVEPESTVDLIRFTNFDKATVDIFKEAAADLDQQPDVRIQLMDT